jgi:hypothetical protein
MTYPFLKQLLYLSLLTFSSIIWFAFVHIIHPNFQDTVYQRFYGIKFPAYGFPNTSAGFRIRSVVLRIRPLASVYGRQSCEYGRQSSEYDPLASEYVRRLPYMVGNPPNTVRSDYGSCPPPNTVAASVYVRWLPNMVLWIRYVGFRIRSAGLWIRTRKSTNRNSIGVLPLAQRTIEHPEEHICKVIFKVGLYIVMSEVHMLMWDSSPFRFTKSYILIFT